jgi:hypothetical protein
MGSAVNGIAINVDATNYARTIIGNAIISTAGTAGAIGIKVIGTTSPRITVLNNTFDPSGIWSGAGASRISAASTNGFFGVTQVESGSFVPAMLSRGALSLHQYATTLTQSDVAAGVLTLPTLNSLFLMAATGATPVTSIVGTGNAGRIVLIRTSNANTTFTDGASLLLAGNFSGPGILTLLVDTTVAYEIARTVF